MWILLILLGLQINGPYLEITWPRLSLHPGEQPMKLLPWTSNEETKLVEELVNLKNVGGFKADNGFKSGYLQHLEQPLKQSLPNSGLLNKPHIESTIKTMKKYWQCVYDMVNSSNTCGFGYDPEKHCVTVEDPVYKEATRSKHKTFPYYEDLCIVFGIDRAQGNRARDFMEMEQEMNLEEETQDSDDDFLDLEEVSHTTVVQHDETSPSVRSKKRKN
uniref:Myb/SANT-like domain-containing protein n=1 Tax=Lactuca sativa TaxID=4236 RepID=A0A9R1UPT2_LACSA|nr:hypothetical protein LSAT_V11C800448180 [Lactuca sativa]